MGSDCRPDPNPFIDEGAPTLTGDMSNAAEIFDQLGINFTVEKLRVQYMHGWGENCVDAKPIRCSSNLTVFDANNWPATLSFDLKDSSTPLRIRMDMSQYSHTCNQKWPRTINFKRPHDVRDYTLYKYITNETTGNQRMRLEVVPHEDTTVRTMLAKTHTRQEMNMAKRRHRFGHRTDHEMCKIMAGTDLDKDRVRDACEEVHEACPICATTGRPGTKKNISTSHINEAINDEILVDFTYADIHGAKM